MKLKVTKLSVIDSSSISNINRLIDIDCYRLISIIIDYRFHRLVRPGLRENNPSQFVSFSFSHGHPLSRSIISDSITDIKYMTVLRQLVCSRSLLYS